MDVCVHVCFHRGISQHFFLTSHSVRGQGRFDCCLHSKWEIVCVACYSFFYFLFCNHKRNLNTSVLKKKKNVGYFWYGCSICVQLPFPSHQFCGDFIMIYSILMKKYWDNMFILLQRTWAIECIRNCCFCVKDWDTVSNNHSSKKPPFQMIMKRWSSIVLINRVPRMNRMWCHSSRQNVQCIPRPSNNILTFIYVL